MEIKFNIFKKNIITLTFFFKKKILNSFQKKRSTLNNQNNIIYLNNIRD